MSSPSDLTEPNLRCHSQMGWFTCSLSNNTHARTVDSVLTFASTLSLMDLLLADSFSFIPYLPFPPCPCSLFEPPWFFACVICVWRGVCVCRLVLSFFLLSSVSSSIGYSPSSFPCPLLLHTLSLFSIFVPSFLFLSTHLLSLTLSLLLFSQVSCVCFWAGCVCCDISSCDLAFRQHSRTIKWWVTREKLQQVG